MLTRIKVKMKRSREIKKVGYMLWFRREEKHKTVVGIIIAKKLKVNVVDIKRFL